LYYSEIPTENFTIRVADGMYLRNDYLDTLYKKIYDCDLGPKKYNYSDLGYYLMKKIIEKYTHTTLDSFVTDMFYKPMGLWSIRYKPRTHFNLDQIVQTEEDKIFRKQILKGDVHDQGAAMLGGVGGHAGLFGNAQHLAVLMQMLLNGGIYNNVEYLKKETISTFTSCQFCETGNRRGLCFEKQEPDKLKDTPTGASASLLSFGHSGFTGTYAWADPETGLVFVFLSNRVNPDSENKKIIKMGIRTKIHDIFNVALKNAK
jgi:beta-N-acetylhexosaminidase